LGAHDAYTGRIIHDTIAPLFKQGDYYGGINAGLDQMIRIVDGEELHLPTRHGSRRRRRCSLAHVGVGAIVIGGMLRPFIGRLGGAGVAGWSEAGGWWLTSRVLLAVGGFAILFLLVLIFGGVGGSRFGGGPAEMSFAIWAASAAAAGRWWRRFWRWRWRQLRGGGASGRW
jgi:uncharacterized protein